MLTDVLIAPDRATKIQQGVYLSRWWNFELDFRRRQDFELDYPDLGDVSCIGVCDSPGQLLEYLSEKSPQVISGDKLYVISMVKIRKDEQESTGGWRWHKWGGYVGKQEPTTEYIADEPLIEEVYTFHIYAA